MTDAYEIACLLTSDVGYVIEVCGLYVSKMKNGKYHVVLDRENRTERIFDDPYGAANFFCGMRKQMRLGFDFPKKIDDELSSETFIG